MKKTKKTTKKGVTPESPEPSPLEHEIQRYKGLQSACQNNLDDLQEIIDHLHEAQGAIAFYKERKLE